MVIWASNKQLFGFGQNGLEDHTSTFLCGHETVQLSDVFINREALDACYKFKIRRKFFLISNTILLKREAKNNKKFLKFFKCETKERFQIYLLSRNQYRIIIFTKRNLGCNNVRKGEKPRTLHTHHLWPQYSSSCLGPPDLAPVSSFHVCISKLVLHLSVFPPKALTMHPPAGYNTQSMLQIRSLNYSPPSSCRSWDRGPLFRYTAPPRAVHLPSSPGIWTENCLQRRAWATDTQSGSMLIRPVTSSATWT